jgi:hypothetical protein
MKTNLPLYFKDTYNMRSIHPHAHYIIEVVGLYGQSIKKDLSGMVPQLCSSTKQYSEEILKDSLYLFKQKIKRSNKVPHYNYFITICASKYAEANPPTFLGEGI